MAATAETGSSVLSTTYGKVVVGLLCAIAFLDFMDNVIVNVALPSMQNDLGFSEQSLQWVPNAYVLTYGGFMLLGGRLADLTGRRRVLVVGTAVFALASLAGGLATGGAMLVAARLVQGAGAALMVPAALSIVTTTFKEGADRNRALSIWGATVGIAAGAGVLLGGVLTDAFGWRSVLLVNPAICALLIVAMFRVLPDDRHLAGGRGFDALGAVLATAGVLLLVYGIVEAPEAGWGSASTILRLVGGAALLIAFVVDERMHRNPLMPLSIFKIRGLAVADGTQLLAMAGLTSMFFFLTLYMQHVLGYSSLKTGLLYLPLTFGIGAGAGIATKLIPMIGTRPLMVTAPAVAAVGIFILARVPADGTFVRDLLPGMMVLSVGLGAVMVAATNAANAGVPADKAGLAASLLNSSTQLGAAIGLAVLATVATSRTNDLLARGTDPMAALTGGFGRGMFVAGIALVVAALLGSRTTNTRSTDAPM
ncbi:MFS transporter [Tsukamurella sp. 8F]|uniref:MFS transporter n=1 Tax=unclassified Tsukamurella TaxID=2633480 RepID=UPI0023BA0454|nr:MULTISPECIES: MFS transporter [unclassified Tsukamurella]MDF0531673.1 MFS transporter [Tsukamurella sp. 8J]MDF0588919.1 MFS transporter [Tsukamurella sp. 8F]